MQVEITREKRRIKTRKMGIEFKIAVNIAIVGALVCTVLMITANILVNDYLIMNIKDKAMIYAQIIAGRTDGDEFDAYRPGDEETESYQAMVLDMFDIFNDEDVSYVYSLKRLDGDKTEFIGAADPAGDPCLIGDTYVLEPEMVEAFEGNGCCL